MTKQEDWTRTLENLAVLTGAGMDVEKARDVFESIHGFRPDTGRPTPIVRRLPWFLVLVPPLVMIVAAIVLIVAGCGTVNTGPHDITITLVRHAQSTANISHVIDSSVPGPSLTQKGQCQAEKIAPELSAQGFDAIYASDMIRTSETAAPTANLLHEQVTILPGVQEITAGAAQGKSERDNNFYAVPMQWVNGHPEVHIPGSDENGREFQDRFTASINLVFLSGNKKPVIFAHQGSIMVWTMMTVLNPSTELMETKPLPNVGRVVIQGHPGAWRLIQWHTDTPGGC